MTNADRDAAANLLRRIASELDSAQLLAQEGAARELPHVRHAYARGRLEVATRQAAHAIRTVLTHYLAGAK